MSEVVGGAELEIEPSVRGFDARLNRVLKPSMDRAGRRAGEQLGDGIARGADGRLRNAQGQFVRQGERAGRSYGTGIERGVRRSSRGIKSVAAATAGTIGLGFGLTGLVQESVQAEAAFSQRMAQIEVNVEGASESSIRSLDRLAVKLGADTVFSANEAADAMLELAKGGFTQAQIEGGGVQATMNLAAAEGMALADAATIVANNMNAYSIKAAQASQITDALAAGSAASTASVASLSEGLSNVGGVARGFGLDINETVGVLAAFDQNALRGAEGGTAFRSMITQLSRPTEKAAGLLEDLGIQLVDRQGNFKDITTLAGIFQDKLGGLTQEERARATAILAGSYGQRALNVLVKEGADGLAGYIEATRQQGKAQELADARMTGTAGTLERLSGAAETAQLEIGRALAPAVDDLATLLTDEAIPATVDFIHAFEDGTGTAGEIRDVLEDVVSVGKGVVSVFEAIPGPVKSAGVELGLAYLAFNKVRDVLPGLSANVVRIDKDMTRLERTQARMMAGARNLAGAGGLLGLTQASQQSSRAMGGLTGALGGALTGFALTGNPIGALIGGVGGGLLGVFTSGNQAADGIDAAARAAAESKVDIDELRTSLDQATGAYTQLARESVRDDLRKSGAFDAGAELGLSMRTITDAALGVPSAVKRVQAAVDKANATFNETTVTVDAFGRVVIQNGDAYQRATSAASRLSNGLSEVKDTSVAAKKAVIEDALATGRLGEVLEGIPDAKVINIATAGDKQARDAIVDLQSRGKGLTDKQLRMLIKVADLPKVLGDLARIKSDADRLAGTRTITFNAAKGSGWGGIAGGISGGAGGQRSNSGSSGSARPRSSTSGTTTAPRGSGRVAAPLVVTQQPVVVDMTGTRMTLDVGGERIEGVISSIADSRYDAARDFDTMVDRSL